MQNLFVVQILHDCLRLGTNHNRWLPASKVNNSIEIEIPRYIKASIISRMFLQIIKPDVFWTHMQKYDAYFTDFDSWKAIEITMNNIYPFNKVYNNHLEKEVDSWTQEKYYPVLKAIQSYNIEINMTKINIFVVNHNLLANQVIRITATSQTYCNFNRATSSTWINASQSSPTKLHLMNKEHGWVILNLQQNGIYRVNYDVENWRRIASYLNSTYYYKIHVLNRAQIIDDSYYFLMMGNLSLSIFLELTSYLSKEEEYIAWYPMFKVLEDMSRFLPLQECTYFKEKIILILNKVSKNIRYPEFNNTIFHHYHYELLREGIAKWACILDLPECLTAAKNNLEWHLSMLAHSNDSIWPGWTDWTFCNGLRMENYRNFYAIFVKHLYLTVFNSKVLRYMACYKNINTTFANIEHFYMYNVPTVQKIDIVRMFCSTIARQMKMSDTLDFMLEKFEELKPQEVNTFIMLIIIINNVYFEKQVEQIRNFVTNSLDKNQHNKSILADFSYFNKNYIKKWLTLSQSVEKEAAYSEIMLLFIETKIRLRYLQIYILKDYYQYLS